MIKPLSGLLVFRLIMSLAKSVLEMLHVPSELRFSAK